MASPKEINYFGEQVILNKELTEQKINDAVAPVMTAVADETTRAQGAEDTLQAAINDTNAAVNTEVTSRQAADGAINTKLGDLANLSTVNKTNLVGAINEIYGTIPDAQVIDTVMSINSQHAVQNKVIKSYVDGIKNNLQGQIDAISPVTGNVDTVPTEGSNNIVASGGTWDAIRFASVKVGETMFWPVSETETRTMHSDNPFNFEVNGQSFSVPVPDQDIELCISKDVPDGWHALDGKAELEAADYPDLAAFMPDNVTTDGKIWLPYVQQKIIKVRY